MVCSCGREGFSLPKPFRHDDKSLRSKAVMHRYCIWSYQKVQSREKMEQGRVSIFGRHFRMVACRCSQGPVPGNPNIDRHQEDVHTVEATKRPVAAETGFAGRHTRGIVAPVGLQCTPVNDNRELWLRFEPHLGDPLAHLASTAANSQSTRRPNHMPLAAFRTPPHKALDDKSARVPTTIPIPMIQHIKNRRRQQHRRSLPHRLWPAATAVSSINAV
ncbi:hypothetical protein QBC35DRAFT_476647 [Podospora australis]|uniref:Uncharacterized protein n=1 Tax=Podospora australis TaxID=1536484 RepID=A0AAN6WNK7_9PEZI|nr:hypothetical protein QBC35DRAFT_476647 [Podospora australis]